MNELLAAGLAMLLVTLVLGYYAVANARLERSAMGAGLSTIEDLLALHLKVSAELGTGLFAQRVGLEGTLECSDPLTSELASMPCAAYRYRVERRWEEEYKERDKEGNKVRRIRTGSDRIAGNERRVPFQLRDSSGVIPVHPVGARLEMERVVDRFEPGNPGQVLRIGGIELPIGGLQNGKRRTIGYHYREEILPLARTVYVLGLAADANGVLAISHMPHESQEPFLVSLRSRAEVMHAARTTQRYTRLAAAIGSILSAILILLGVYGSL